MADYDFPMDTSPPPEGSAYPDIDETLHYPWQGSRQSTTDNLPASVIDPRLYQDLFPQNEPESQQDYSAEELSEDSQAPPGRKGKDEDSEFVYTEDESDR
jgi:general transcription factor 3C polypeptide 3 (transcription factor C subunit 4)